MAVRQTQRAERKIRHSTYASQRYGILYTITGGVVSQRVGRRTCDSQLTGSTRGRPLLRSNLRQIVHHYASVTKQCDLVLVKRAVTP